MLRAELRECGKRVVDAQERGGVVGDLEVRGALRDELGRVSMACVVVDGGWRSVRRRGLRRGAFWWCLMIYAGERREERWGGCVGLAVIWWCEWAIARVCDFAIQQWRWALGLLLWVAAVRPWQRREGRGCSCRHTRISRATRREAYVTDHFHKTKTTLSCAPVVDSNFCTASTVYFCTTGQRTVSCRPRYHVGLDATRNMPD